MQVKEFLESSGEKKLWYSTLHVLDVQADLKFQKLGIDLLWLAKTTTGACCITLEVKGDRRHDTGNFFFETVSNVAFGTMGAFLGCHAEWYCYYYLGVDELYCIPMLIAKPWFMNNLESFRERKASSEKNGATWTTSGRLVPRRALLRAVPDTEVFRKLDGSWERVSSVQRCVSS